MTSAATVLDYATRCRCAAFILNEAAALGIRVGTDGTELVMLAPMRVPREVRRQFEVALDKFRTEIIAAIQLENAGGRA